MRSNTAQQRAAIRDRQRPDTRKPITAPACKQSRSNLLRVVKFAILRIARCLPLEVLDSGTGGKIRVHVIFP